MFDFHRYFKRLDDLMLENGETPVLPRYRLCTLKYSAPLFRLIAWLDRLDHVMNTSRISLLCSLLILFAGCTHPLSRADKKTFAKMAQVGITMAFIGAGGAGGTAAASMDEGAAGTVAFGVGSGILLKQQVVMSLDRRQQELQQSRSATQGYLIVERPVPSRLHLYTSDRAGFIPGSIHLTPQSRMALNDIAAVMRRHADAKVIITDNSDPLSVNRAVAVAHYLQQQGIEVWRIETVHSDNKVVKTAGRKTFINHRPLDISMSSQLLDLKKDLDLLEQSLRALPSTLRHDLIVKRAGRDRLKLTMAHQAAFKRGSSQLTAQGSAVMASLTAMLKRHPYASVDIIGHADDGATAEANKKLSLQRAQTIADYLKQRGMDPLRIHNDGTGHAAYQVAGHHKHKDAYRRVEITVANRLFNLAKYTSLQEEEALLFLSATQENLIVKRPTLNKLNLILAHQASFSPGSAQLRPQATTALKETVAMLKRYRSSVIHVIGHAKENSSSLADMKLSARRAGRVADFLQQQGIADVRLNSKGMGRALYAATAYDNSADIFRRVEITIEARHAI